MRQPWIIIGILALIVLILTTLVGIVAFRFASVNDRYYEIYHSLAQTDGYQHLPENSKIDLQKMRNQILMGQRISSRMLLYSLIFAIATAAIVVVGIIRSIRTRE